VNARDTQGSPIDEDTTALSVAGWTALPAGGERPLPAFIGFATAPTQRAAIWEADLFLCSRSAPEIPSAAEEASVEPLLGVRWGFRIVADGGVPTPLTPRWTGDWAWASWVPVLRKRFPNWRFADRTPSFSWKAGGRA
jgi:hypothetical protein